MNHNNIICGIYKYTSPSGRIYIGSSKNIFKRILHYKNLDCKGQIKLYNSFKKYGYNNHIFEIIEECSEDLLYSKENHYGNLFNVLNKGLNISLPGVNDKKFIFSEESKRQRSERLMGNKNHFYGKTHSSETKQKIREFQSGRKHTLEHKMKVSKNHAKSNSKSVIDLETGIFYDSIKEAAIAKNINHSTLKSRVNGSSPTYTSIKFI